MAYEGAIGIDLGTTYSSVGVWENEEVKIIENDQGNRRTPSYVAFTDTERLIGDAAMNQVAMNPTNTVFDVKRLMGRKFSDPVVQSGMKHWPFKVISDAKDNPLIEVQYHGETKTFRPEQISAMVLVYMKQMAESYLGKEVKKAVISVPTHFTQRQRQATMDAGRIAGLKVLHIIDEPDAAAIAYGLINKENIDKYGKSHFVLIFDLGGGMFDVTLSGIDRDVFEVVATSGDPHLGGEDFDSRLVAHFIDEFKRKNNGKDMSNDPHALRRLRTACERLKRTLSSAEEATIEIDALYDNIDFRATITRAQFEELCDDLFCRLKQPLEQMMNDWGYSKNYVHEVVLVGGSTRIPKVRQMVSDFFGGKELNNSINPDEAVAYGAAVWGFVLIDSRRRHTEELQLLQGVVLRTIGVETAGGVMKKILERNAEYTGIWRYFVPTTSDNQTAMSIRVFEGDNKMTKDCHLIGEFKVSDIPPAPCGKTEIEFPFDLDANGILNVKAKKKGTDNYYQINIKNDKSRLSKADIKRMTSDQSKYEEQDKQQRDQKVDTMKQLENTISSLNDNMDDLVVSMDMDENIKAIINEAIGDARCLVHSNVATVKEYDRMREQLQWLYQIILKGIDQRRVESKNMLQDYITSIKDKIIDPRVSEQFDEREKSVITQAVEDAEGWLENNPDARREVYERYKKEIECTCTPIITLLQLDSGNSEYSDFVMVD